METNRLGVCKTLDKNKIIILVDTNFLLHIVEGLISPSMILDTVLRSYTLVTCPQVIDELLYLSNYAHKQKTRRNARKALFIAEKMNICTLDCPGEKADDAIVIISTSLANAGHRIVVGTSDKGLRRRVRSHGVPTLYYRESEGILELEWEHL